MGKKNKKMMGWTDCILFPIPKPAHRLPIPHPTSHIPHPAFPLPVGLVFVVLEQGKIDVG
jgi:hypothetical protein